MKCPYCEGEGGWEEYYGMGMSQDIECPICDATGNVSIRHRLSIWFWDNIPVEIVEWYGNRRYERWLDTESELDDG